MVHPVFHHRYVKRGTFSILFLVFHIFFIFFLVLLMLFFYHVRFSYLWLYIVFLSTFLMKINSHCSCTEWKFLLFLLKEYASKKKKQNIRKKFMETECWIRIMNKLKILFIFYILKNLISVISLWYYSQTTVLYYIRKYLYLLEE